PPRFGHAGVAGDDLDVEAVKLEAKKVFAYACKAFFVAVERDELHLGKLQQMRGLAPWRRASVEHPLARQRLQQRRRKLRTQILDRERTTIESRQRAHTHRGLDEDSRIACRRGVDSRGGELRQQRVARRDAAVDAKRERRLRIAGGKDVLPLGGKFALHALDPPT